MELKALVTERISRYHEYRQLYRQLHECTSTADIQRVARSLITAYIDNQQAWRELHHYQQHHRVLGEHPIFSRMKALRQLRTMNLRDLIRREQQLRDNLWRVRSEMKKGTKPHLTQRRLERIRTYEEELGEIRRLLGEG